MISVFSFNRVLREQSIIEKGCRSQTARKTEDKLTFTKTTAPEQLAGDGSLEGLTDLVYFEIRDPSDVEALRRLRQKGGEALLMILTSPTVSPMQYLRPGIAPDLLLLRPFAQREFDQVNEEMFDAFLQTLDSPDPDEQFVLGSREGKILIPYHRIQFFEASNKKINVRTDREEYDFYDSIENLQTTVPAYFVRCHRSYLVNSRKIRKIRLSEGIIEMEGGAAALLSRTYRQDIKRLIT